RSGKVLDVAGSSTADGARVVQATPDGRASQQWQLRHLSGGVFQVVNRNSGKVLDVNSGSTADGAALIQYADRGSTNQQWTFRRVTPWGTPTGRHRRNRRGGRHQWHQCPTP